MKAITIRQPWAWLFTHGPKTIETRTRALLHRGPLAIHAGRSVDERALANFRRHHPDLLPDEALPLGVILGVTEIIETRWLTKEDEHQALCPAAGRFGLVRGDVQLLIEPLAVRGQLGLWTLPEAVERQIAEQLHALRIEEWDRDRAGRDRERRRTRRNHR